MLLHYYLSLLELSSRQFLDKGSHTAGTMVIVSPEQNIMEHQPDQSRMVKARPQINTQEYFPYSPDLNIFSASPLDSRDILPESHG